MALPIGEQSAELLKAQDLIWNHLYRFISSMSLRYATELGIPDIIHRHGKPMTLQQLVDALPINKGKAHGVYRLMRILIHSGFFIEEQICKDDAIMGYWLTPASRLLIKDEAFSMYEIVQACYDPIALKPWDHVKEWFENDDSSAFETTFGMSYFDYASRDSKENETFNELMVKDTQMLSSVLIRDCKKVFNRMKSMVDVGGGVGILAKAIADAFPDLQCTVFDLPHVVAGLQGTENLTYVQGNMFESIPKADAVMLKWILHDWNDEDCVRILKKCKEVIPSKESGGKVIIIDMVVGHKKDDHRGIETQLFYDLSMMVFLNGKERTEKEFEKLFFDAGYSGYKIVYELGLRSLIEVYP
ncbi:Flavone 3'-O-methyltransferase 1 [Abeliophyllum distichum]|uniref:Flavone 3'-O-methyltransferase 1 n=1 Tax=Abeliophyllum distichum TaxID=126358 RepID=A0ABD1PRU0_9LAMI